MESEKDKEPTLLQMVQFTMENLRRVNFNRDFGPFCLTFWTSGEFEGRGEMKFSTGDKYVGQWKKGLKHGRGVYTYSNGDVYDGEYKHNIKEGHGQLRASKNTTVAIHSSYADDGWKDGDVFEGEFKNGKFEGKGVFISADQNFKYEGHFVNDAFDGPGVLLNRKTGETYTGHFQKVRISRDFENGSWSLQGERSGKGKTVNKDGMTIYEGEYHNNKMEGHGTYYWSNGTVYTGEFQNGKPHGLLFGLQVKHNWICIQGKGKLKTKEGEVIHEGKFENGAPATKP